MRRVLPATCGFALVAAIYFFSSEAPVPADAVAGQLIAHFTASAPFDPPANFSLEMRAHMEAGALSVEKLEFFYEPGPVPHPTITSGPDGTAQVHVWVTRPRIRLFNTKCEFVRNLQFAIPKSALVSASKLVLVNHDTGAVQVLAEAEALSRLLREPECPTQVAKLPPNQSTGGGCGA